MHGRAETAHLDSPVEFYCKREQRRGVRAVWDHPRTRGRWFWFALLFIGCVTILASLCHRGESDNAGERKEGYCRSSLETGIKTACGYRCWCQMRKSTSGYFIQ